MNWTNTFQHPLTVGAYIQAHVPPCATCNKIRGWVPGMPALKPLIYEGTINHIFHRNGTTWYQINTGRLIDHKHVKFVRDGNK